jgi:hypothetical protein
MTAWLAGLWFTVFPLTAWAYYLLAISVAGVGLWSAWRLSARWLDGDKRILGLALLTLVPFYNFHALKYNANTVQIPFWGLTTWWFLRSFETCRPLYAALAGLAAAGAMLTKYWSVFLLAGLALAAMLDARRTAYFRSSAPWITVGVGSLALAPHAYWLVLHDFLPFNYVTDRALHSPGSPIPNALDYFAGVFGYVGVPVALTIFMARFARPALADTLFPAATERRLPMLAFVLPLLLPAVVSLAGGVRVSALWTMPAFTLLPVVLLSSPLLQVPRRAVIWITAAAMLIPIVMAAASPLVAVVMARTRPDPADFRLLAEAIDGAWRQTTNRPLRIVAGDRILAFGTAYHLPDKPSAFQFFSFTWSPYLDEARIRREGLAAVCAVEDQNCLAQAEARAARVGSARRSEVEIPGGSSVKKVPPRRYVIIAVPPQPD